MTTNWTLPAISVGWLIALLVLLVTVVLLVTNQIELRLGLLISGLAVARLT